MSLFGALTTAVSGLTAQSNAFSNISDGVSNSQTIGYKRVDTSFQDYLTQSSAIVNVSGAVVSRPLYQNDVQGTVTQTGNPLNLAIAGSGFFKVSETDASAKASTSTLPSFQSLPYYTRAGDFTLDKNGYVVNSAGQYLNGWSVNSTTGVVNENSLTPVQIAQTVYDPVQTTEVSLAANLPASPSNGSATYASPLTSQVTVYDSLGTAQTITLNWSTTGSTSGVANPDALGNTVPAGTWTVQLTQPNPAYTSTNGAPQNLTIGTADVTFNTDGTPAAITNVTAGDFFTAANSALGGAVTLSSTTTVPQTNQTAGNPAAMTFTTDFTNDNSTKPQSIVLNLGIYGTSSGVTNFAGTDYSLRSLTQDGAAPGSFSSLSTNNNGDVIVNYDNGQSLTVARIPVITFNNPDGLQRQNGQAFTANQASGNPVANSAGSNGAGKLVTQSTEGSNVDIATEFSNLIVTQQAYSANAKLVTTASDMLTTTIDMKR